MAGAADSEGQAGTSSEEARNGPGEDLGEDGELATQAEGDLGVQDTAEPITESSAATTSKRQRKQKR